jgi:hypothetical protein
MSAHWTQRVDVLAASHTFIKASLIRIQQRIHILIYHVERVCTLRFRRDIWWARVVMERRNVFSGAGAKVYDIAPVVRLLFHLLAQPAAAVTSDSLSQLWDGRGSGAGQGTME